MLTHLHLQNFAIIDDLELSFSSGMTAITGETGVGKSIIIDAISLVLGGRAASDWVKHGEKRATITLNVDIRALKDAANWLAEHELDQEEECILRRTISAEGKSSAFINGVPTTTQNLRNLGTLLIHLHSQHQSQQLLQPKEQLHLLDQFGKHESLLQAVEKTFAELQITEKKLKSLIEKNQSSTQRIEFLQFQVNEIEALELKPNEVDELEQEYKQLSNADKILDAGKSSLDMIDDETGITHLLNQAIHRLEQSKESSAAFKNALTALNQALINTEEASSELNHFLSDFDLDPERLNFIDQRLSTIHQVAHKHRVQASELAQFLETMQTELAEIAQGDDLIDSLKKSVETLQQQYDQQAKQLSDARIQNAKKLSAAVSQHIQNLGMPKGQFIVTLQARPARSAEGAEKAQFDINLNPGHAAQPLAKVASGGELSRISLAIYTITAKQQPTTTLIFDEVDAGIGGETGNIVGKLLRQLAKSNQVFCITHLAQVAAKAHHHVVIHKEVNKKQTQTTAMKLTEEERILEIARMTTGKSITDEMKSHAKAMLENMD